MKLILSLILIFSPFACSKFSEPKKPKKKINAEISQVDFDSYRISVYEQGNSGKIYLSNYPIKIIAGRKTFDYITDEKGEIKLKIPEDIAINLDKIVINIENKNIDYKPIKQQIKIEIKANLDYINYYKFNLNLSKIIYKQKWPPEDEKFANEN